VAAAVEMAGTCSPDDILLINLSGRGDKDVTEAERLLESHSMLPGQ
jgi:tryptophan synthase beta subunit